MIEAVHTSRSAYNHLLALAATHGIAKNRVVDVIEMVGPQDVARKRAGGFSLGMGQRLGPMILRTAEEPLDLGDPGRVRRVDGLQGVQIAGSRPITQVWPTRRV